MTPSIRTFLLINLLLGVTLIMSLAIIANLFLAHRDIQSQLNTRLAGTAARMQILFSDYQNPKLDKKINNSLSVVQKSLLSKTPNQFSNHAVAFQIWNESGKLLLHSADTPPGPFSKGLTGISTRRYHKEYWQVFTLVDPKTKLTFMVAESLNHRQQLVNQLTRDSVIIMFLTYPFLGILIWIIVGSGLSSLKKIAREVRHRAPSNLEPVKLDYIPFEIAPLIRELNQLFARLQEAFEREKRFTADAAHELKTPLAALNTHTQIALRAKTSEERKTALLKVIAGVNRSTHVVQQLLTLNRLMPEAFIHERKSMDLVKEVTDIATQLAPDAVTKNIDLELIAPESPSLILGNATAVGILIRNLVDNAVRYSPSNSTVTIKIEKTPDQITLRVIDNGPGIPVELHQRVFERFFRILGNPTTGSGLGLSIVQQIAKLHQAKIELNSGESGEGLDFKVTFQGA